MKRIARLIRAGIPFKFDGRRIIQADNENQWEMEPFEYEVDENGHVEIKIITNDAGAEALVPLIAYIGDIGNVGHSFSIIVDPDMVENKKTFGWDGDGADRIDEIYVSGKKLGG